MTPEHYGRVREVFIGAREKDPHERGRFLDRACADDDRLRAEVERLLANDDEADTFLQTPVLGEDFAKAHPESLVPQAASASEHESSAGIGTDRARPSALPNYIGQYRILDVLGEGGMGIVYRAEQGSPRRTVALKVIRAGAESRDMLKRFEHEGQVLGWLQHPGIAQIFEAGTADTQQGLQPFFAMEFIHGSPLTRYATAEKLALAQRLELIAKVCDAVHHAHQKGVIHRDLKPGNILIDDSGQPKVLDFGVARVTDADIRTTTLQTDVGQLVGTLAYMSPEQVAGDSRQLDTRSDVYALGVILYELLAGRVPFDASQQTIPQVVRMITEDEPTSLSSINRIFRGDVDTIVAKALEKDKERRYQSVAGLAADIRRYLSDEPISARPASAVYQLRKFARRNRALVGGVLATLVVLLIGVAGTSYGLMQATARRRDAEAERNRALAAEGVAEQRREEAERQSAIAQAVVDFLNEDLLRAADPRNTPNREITVKEALDTASVEVEGKFEDEPLVEAAIRMTLGATYKQLGEYDAAEPHLERALELRRDILGEQDRDTVKSMGALGAVYEKHGLYEKAEPLLVRALDLSRRVLGKEDYDTVVCMSDLGELYRAQGRFGEAEPLLTEALEISQRELGQEHPTTLVHLNNLALVHGYMGRYDEAEPLFVRALEIRRRVLDEGHPSLVSAINNLGALYRHQGRLAEAEPLFVEALDIAQRVLGADHPRTLTYLNNLALIYREQGRVDEAEPLYVTGLEASTRALGADHPKTLMIALNLGALHRDQGRYAEAEALLVETLGGYRGLLGDEHPRTLTTMNHLGLVYRDQGRHEEARSLFADGLEIGRRTLGPEHPRTLTAMSNLALVYCDQQRYEEAEPLFVEVLETRRRVLGNEHPQTLKSMRNLARLYVEQGRYAGAEPLLLDSYARMKHDPDARPDQLHEVLDAIIRLYTAWDKPGSAAEWRATLEQHRATTQPAMLRPAGTADPPPR
jgi:tetratricopeptide (TPR) repeat protein/predicted Ser/Thr protein kinase